MRIKSSANLGALLDAEVRLLASCLISGICSIVFMAPIVSIRKLMASVQVRDQCDLTKAHVHWLTLRHPSFINSSEGGYIVPGKA